jgi:hypothetical protein
LFCRNTPGKDLSEQGHGYRIRTLRYSYYFRCRPCAQDYDIYCFAYDNRRLLHAPEHEHTTVTPDISKR